MFGHSGPGLGTGEGCFKQPFMRSGCAGLRRGAVVEGWRRVWKFECSSVHGGDNKGRLGKPASPFLVTRGKTSTAPVSESLFRPRYCYPHYTTLGSSPPLSRAPGLKLNALTSWYEVTGDQIGKAAHLAITCNGAIPSRHSQWRKSTDIDFHIMCATPAHHYSAMAAVVPAHPNSRVGETIPWIPIASMASSLSERKLSLVLVAGINQLVPERV